uniref:HNH endonuclease n=1 Tax=Eubacterium cellulosolvens TaxID=29322 RepID=UPI000553B9BB|nr:HNH endonuclease signature motif containing protein [[Eubacterium] cellulosolvens]
MLFIDGHTCQCCKGRSKDKILNVHHIERRKTGGNAPNNLITLFKNIHRIKKSLINKTDGKERL